MSKVKPKILNSFIEFFRSSVAGGIVLIVVTLIAMLWANSEFWEAYKSLWETKLSINFGQSIFHLSLHQWINDGLMAIFFFLVGLEIKRELLIGELSSIKKAILPVIAAAGGIIFPALIYSVFNFGLPSNKGWAIPMATDIAFALGALALLGKRVPLGIKIFLAALAIADDLAAVIIIAIFYSAKLNITALILCFTIIAILFIINKINIYKPYIYIILGLCLWLAMLQSGVHATIAGVITAIFVPVGGRLREQQFVDEVEGMWYEYKSDNSKGLYDITNTLKELFKNAVSPLVRMEHSLSLAVAFFIMPLFALANAGIYFGTLANDILLNPITLGVYFGLFLGKPIGVSLFVWLALKMKMAQLPSEVKFNNIVAVSFLCGIGFTMSLFISNLSFGTGANEEVYSKIGILFASLSSGIIGYVLMRYSLKIKKMEV